MSLSFAGLMCHAPIVIPEVAGAREAGRCRSTTRAMREVAERAVASKPDRLVLVSPHSPRAAHDFSAWAGPRHRGDLGDFRAPSLVVDLPDAPEVAQELGLPLIRERGAWLDHGAMVPLIFLWRAGWRGRTAILGLPGRPGQDGRTLGRRLADLVGNTALIASGDMSHRLKPGAPAGYHPLAHRFDEAFVHALETEDWAAALTAGPRAEAAEDVVDSTSVAMGAAGRPLNSEVLSYEGPWGVGYTEAVLYDPQPALYAVARRAIRDQARGRRPRPAPAGGTGPAGVFVTLHKHGQLRGCMGHIRPTTGRLYDEVADVARMAATQDPRFPPVDADELDELDVEVSVLQAPEPIAGPEQLDPRLYGVIATAGRRRGLLLPDLEGVDTVDQQLSIVRRKAGIRPGTPVQLERFQVRKEAQP